jgi:tRNA pseudouridine65 synthase/23S rRNA pseudouridine1911/1915/1917 synthase
LIILEKHIVPESIENVRLVDYALPIFPSIPTRSALKKTIKRGEILINNKFAEVGTWILPGQEIELIDLETKIPKPFPLCFDIIFEDNFLAVINKPPGISVSGNKFNTIQNAIIGKLSPSTESDTLKFPRPAHRLDYSTSGLLLIAKTASALADLGWQFENRKVSKKYRAIVIGKMAGEGEFDSPIDGQEALTRFVLLESTPSLHTEWISLVDLYPLTGRTHQLRIHLAEAGFPILGDKKYGPREKALQGKGLFLAAIEISFYHPFTKKQLTFQIPQPEKFLTFPARETKRWKKYQ